MIRQITHIFVTAFLLGGLSGVAHADGGRMTPRFDSELRLPLAHIAPARIAQPYHYAAVVDITPSRAKQIALSHVPKSEFLDIKLVNGRVYIVRLMKNGRRIDVRVDARTGKIRN